MIRSPSMQARAPTTCHLGVHHYREQERKEHGEEKEREGGSADGQDLWGSAGEGVRCVRAADGEGPKHVRVCA